MNLAPKSSKYPTAPARSSSASAAKSGCGLINFERPNYFGGHLLTDNDLTLEQCYFRDKTRLFHRVLDGHGIVSGLRLTCVCNAPEEVAICRGYAIDNCGNDLIIAHDTTFDVVSRLIEKGLILRESPAETDLPRKAESEHALRRCFYLVIKYEEEQTAFAAPLIGSSQTTLNECEPTRVRETVQIDVCDSLPPEKTKESILKERLEAAFSVFTEGPFAQALHKNQPALKELVDPDTAWSSKEAENRHGDYYKLFFDLRALLLLYFNQRPDRYWCNLETEIRRVRFPELRRKSDKAEDIHLEEVRDAFSGLLGLAWQHAVSAALGELMPLERESCGPEPIVLGTVFVENGQVIRVCNCPRSYVWSFGTFPEVLLASALGELACKTEPGHEREAEEKEHREVCCRDFDFDLECFLKWIHLDRKAHYHAGTELIHWLESLKKSFRAGFDFTDPCNFSARIFEGMETKKVTEILKMVNLQARMVEAPLEAREPDLASLVGTAGLATGEEAIVLTVKEEMVTGAAVDQSELHAQITHLQSQLNSLRVQLEKLQPPRSPGGGQK